MLKNGETDIESTDISKFALHSDYKCYKVGNTGNDSFTMSAGTSSASGEITHGLGYIPVFFAYIEHESKGYLVNGSDNSPVLNVPSGGLLGYTLISFNVRADSSKLYIDASASSFLGTPSSSESFVARAFFMYDKII